MSLYDLKNYKHTYTYPYFTDEDTGTQRRLSYLSKITQLSCDFLGQALWF